MVGITVRLQQQMAGACRLFSGAHTVFQHFWSTLRGLVGLFAYLSIAFFGFLGSPSALPSPSLDVASTVR